jgi:hypothetical protein
MNNYHLTSIQETGGTVFLQTSFYRIPVYASKEAIEQTLENELHENVHDILKSGKIELFWMDNKKQHMAVLAKLLAKNSDASFLPDGLQEQLLNVYNDKQPCKFFVEKSISHSRNPMGAEFAMKLKLSCEVEPNKRGFKHGFNLSIVAGNSIYLVSVDGDLKIVSASEKEEYLLPNNVFNKDCQSRQSLSIALGLQA